MKPMGPVRSALIGGGGIGGLSAAIALRQLGINVTVVERATTYDEIGAGLQLSPNAVKALRILGVEAQVIARGFEPLRARITHYKTAKHFSDISLRDVVTDRYGAAYVHIHRADLHQILLNRARELGAEVVGGLAISGYRQDADAISVFAGDREFRADIAVAADGARSVLRDQMLNRSPLRFTGQVAWRALIPATRLPAGRVAPNATVWVGPGRHLVTYYLRGGELVNIVAVEERDDWTDPSWRQRGDAEEMRRAFADWHPDVTDLLEAVDVCHLWALFDSDPLPKLVDDRLILLGDAAHPTLPFMAQGAAMALEDAVTLGSALSAPSADLSFYQKERLKRTLMVQRMSRANASLFHLNQGPWGLISKAKLGVVRAFPALSMLALDRVFKFDPGNSVTGRSKK